MHALKLICLAIALSFIASPANALFCDFYFNSPDFICQLSFPSSHNESDVLVDGDYLDGFSAENVTVITTVKFDAESSYKVLTGNILRSFPNLRTFDLRFLDMRTVEGDSFGENCATIGQIDLSHNSLQNLSENVFASCSSLESLRVAHNSLQTLSLNLPASLHSVDFASNHLRSVNLPQISAKVFNFSNNFLTRLQLEAVEVTELDASVNSLAAIPAINLDAVKKLKLAANPLVRLTETALKYARNLEVLDLSTCRLQSIDEYALFTLDSLRELHLQHNSLSACHREVFRSNLRHLRLLDLSANRIPHIDCLGLENLESLTTLRLAHNAIRRLGSFPASLEAIDLSWNDLTVLDFKAAAVPPNSSLAVVDVSYNRLVEVDVEPLRHLRLLRALGNPCVDGEFNSSSLHLLDCPTTTTTTTMAATTTTTAELPPEEEASPKMELAISMFCILLIAILLFGLVWYAHSLFVVRAEAGVEEGKKRVRFEDDGINYNRF